MLKSQLYPILEFDTAEHGMIDPETFARRKFDCDKMIITFFPEVIDKLLSEGKIVPDLTIPGENPVYTYRFADDDVLITLGIVGCPSCAGNLDLFHAMGIDKVMFCGGGGVLDRSIAVGQLLLVDGAIRDEGFSYHYLPPARVVHADERVNAIVSRYLEEHDVPYLRGLSWTTDAIFRETADRVALRREEGAKIVEMEQAGCLAVAQCRGFAYGALLYGGDDLSGEEWDNRGWRSREGIRYDLVMLEKEILKRL